VKIGDIEYSSLKGKVSQAEWTTRVELAAIFRMHHMSGWSDLLQAAASARIPGENHYLFVPAGCVWDEITASSLVKVTLDGEVVSDTPFNIIRDFWFPMEAVHAARPDDANFLIHTHNAYAIALSARKEGLLPLSQAAAVVLASKVVFHEYEGVETYEAAMPGLQRALGDANSILLRNHGALVLGRTAFEAFLRMDQLLEACRVQVLAGRASDLVQMSPEVLATFPYEMKRSEQYPGQWLGLLRRLDRIDQSYRE
jgi:ribulose-5-phosphate 4-epimerase/fuculose-1-phosphate aldolase